MVPRNDYDDMDAPRRPSKRSKRQSARQGDETGRPQPRKSKRVSARAEAGNARPSGRASGKSRPDSTRASAKGKPASRRATAESASTRVKGGKSDKIRKAGAIAGLAAAAQAEEEEKKSTRRKKRMTIETEEAELDITPMIDCVFLLLIFFMCATKFKTVEDRFDANLPKDEGIEASMKPEDIEKPPPINIGILDNDPAKNSPDPQVRFGRRATFVINAHQEVRTDSEMRQILKNLQKDTQVNVYPIKGGTSIPFKEIIRLMDLCYDADLTDIRFRPPTTN